MGKFSYSVDIGQYDEQVRLSIGLTIKGSGVDDADYASLKAAFATIEEISLKYKEAEDVDSN